MKKIAIIFATASILGYVMESLFVFAAVGVIPDSGNHGFYYQFYGFCALAIYFIYTKFKFKPLTFFIFGIFLAAGIEFLASFLLDHILNITAWSYCTEFTNIFCRTTLARGLLLSAAATIYLAIFAPFFLKLGKEKFFLYACYFICIYIIFDTLFEFLSTIFSKI